MTRTLLHRHIYVALLCLAAVAMPCSNFVMNMAWVFLLVNWLIEGDFRRKGQRLRDSRLLQAFLFLFVLHLVGLLWSSNLAYGLDDIRKKLPMLVVPLVVLTSQPLRRIEMRHVLCVYVVTLLVVCCIGLVRWLTIVDLPYRTIVPFISHIRFSLNLCIAVALLLFAELRSLRRCSEPKTAPLVHVWRVLLALIVFAFLCFLLLLQSYTGFAVLLVLALVTLLFYWRRIPSVASRVVSLSLLLVLIVGGTLLVGSMVRDYYRLVPIAQQPLVECTINGNPYNHHRDGVIENGNYINNYICRREMEREWGKRSALSIDTPQNGYTLYPTLIRYLNALGLTKDSVGIAQLTQEDVRNIERGIPNPVYADGSPVRRMVYVMLYERENYLHLHAVCNFTMLQRFELWRNGWRVFLQQPLIGTGTGDVVDCCHAQLAADQSPLAGTTKHTHNQYLTLLITFGTVGFLLIVMVFLRAVVGHLRRERREANFPLLAAAVIVLISCLTEDTFETLAGILFATFWLALFACQPLHEEPCLGEHPGTHSTSNP